MNDRVNIKFDLPVLGSSARVKTSWNTERMARVPRMIVETSLLIWLYQKIKMPKHQ